MQFVRGRFLQPAPRMCAFRSIVCSDDSRCMGALHLAMASNRTIMLALALSVIASSEFSGAALSARGHTHARQVCTHRAPTPTGPSAAAAQLANDLGRAVASGAPHFSVPASVYDFGNTSLVVDGAYNLVVSFEPGTEFRFHLGSGVLFTHCANVTVLGNALALDASPLNSNYAQGKVLSIDVDASGATPSFMAEFDPAFLAPDSACDPFSNSGAPHGAGYVVFWDPKERTMLAGRTSQTMNNSKLVEGTSSSSLTWQITMSGPWPSPPPLGSLVTVFPRRGFTWSMKNCTRMTTDNVTIHAGGNEGFTESFGDGGNVYRGARIVRRNGSTGLLTTNADGFNIDSVGVGPTLEGCEVGFNGDDLFSVHNRMQVVCGGWNRTESRNTALVMDLGQGPYQWDKVGSVLNDVRAGDTLEFWPPTDDQQTRLGEGTVASTRNVTADPDALRVCAAAFVALQAQQHGRSIVEPFAAHTIYDVVFTSAPVAKGIQDAPCTLASVPRRSSVGAVVRGCHFHDGAQRMGIIGASGMVVDSNMFGPSLNGGLHVESEVWALEGDMGVTSVSISNNLIVVDRPSSACGGIDVMTGLQNVSCRNNTFVVDGVRRTLASTCN
jgi:hypothetical protein